MVTGRRVLVVSLFGLVATVASAEDFRGAYLEDATPIVMTRATVDDEETIVVKSDEFAAVIRRDTALAAPRVTVEQAGDGTYSVYVDAASGTKVACTCYAGYYLAAVNYCGHECPTCMCIECFTYSGMSSGLGYVNIMQQGGTCD